jgi:acetolactate synthase-1/2/3 large subunit
MYKIWFARNYKAWSPNTLLLDNALGTMGAGLPSAIASKLLNPTKRVLAVCGDGGLMMSSQEIETAVRLNLDITILVLRDDGYGMIKWEQEEKGFDNFALDFKNPDFVKFAESFGAKGYRVEKVEDLESLLNKSFNEKGVKLIDLPIDYTDNIAVLGHELPKLIENIK